jgi:hypothetical protein
MLRERMDWRCVVGACAILALAGCDTGRGQWLRTSSASKDVLADPVQSDPSFARPAELKGFFAPGRWGGGWSPEARGIERSLGVDS